MISYGVRRREFIVYLQNGALPGKGGAPFCVDGVKRGDDMAKAFTDGFYGTRAWKKCRAGYTKSVGGLCER